MTDNGNPNGAPRDRGTGDQATIAALREENEKLAQQVAELREDKRAVMEFVAHLLWKDEPEIDLEAVLEEARALPPFAELVAEIERMGK